MSNVQLYAKQQHTEEYVALDLRAEEPIKLNLSVANIIDPTATNSVFSRTFKVPHTAVNGPYFEGVFNVNSMNFDASVKADAYILDNGIFFENGNIRLNAINVNSKDNSVEYEITFYGSTSDFGSKIGGGFLNEVNLNKYNHSKTWQNITSSWTTQGGLFNGDIRYGLIEWGYTYDNNNRPNIPTLSAGFDNSFTNPTAPTSAKAYRLTQWKPQIRAKALWDQIFEESGYTYDSTFLDSSFFTNQYIISDNIASATLDNSNTFSAERQGIYNNVVGATFPWITPVELADPGNNFAPSQTVSGVYTAPSSGNYIFEMNAEEVSTSYHGNTPITIGWEAKAIDVDTGLVVGLDISSFYFDFNNPYAQNTVQAAFYLNLQANQRIKFQFRTWGQSGPYSTGGTSLWFANLSLACTDAPNVMSINGIMPSNIRKIDFMKSIINRYRLVFIPSKFQANHFTITPWKDWILEGRSKDWTDRLDVSKDIVIKPLFFDQARFQIYKDQEDSDYLNYNYQLGIKQTFGQLNLDSDNELIKGTKEYKDQFAPTPLDGIGLKPGTGFTEEAAALFLIPHIAKDTGGNGASEGTGANAVSVGKREPIQPKLRLVFWNGLKNAPINWYAGTDQDGSGVPTTQQTMFDYPLMSQYSEFPVTSTTFDLNWENELPLYDYNAIGQAITNPKAQTAFSCFNTFWKTWYDVTFDPYSRIVEAYFALDYNEILDLKFNDYIFVKDAWYFVNSVSDYIVGEVSNCKVQLIKLGNNIGITLPVITPPTYTQFDTCYSATDLCVAHCCAQYAGSQSTIIYGDAVTLADSTIAYQDATGGILAAPGYYSDASGTVYVNSNGVILVQDTSACNCVPVYYTFSVHLNSTGCDVCCNNGPLITVYGANPTFDQNGSFYSNTLLTIPGPAGFYKESGATTALQVIQNGSVVNNFLCNTCNCTVYYPFTVCKSDTLCDSCCCPNGTITVWGDNPTFASNTNLYLDNSGATAVPQSWYKFNSTTVAQVTGSLGAITSFGTCSGCPTCPAGPVDGTVNVSAAKPGYSTTTLVQKSYDNGSTWVDVVSVTIGPSDPANTEISQIFSVENNVKLRAINTTNTVGGAMQTNYKIGIDTFENSSTLTPNSVTLTIPSATDEIYTYEFNNLVTGGQVLETDLVYSVGKYNEYQNAGWPSSGGGSIGSILALDAQADIYTTFDAQTGFYGGDSNNITFAGSITGNDNNLFATVDPINSNPITYKGTTISNQTVKLNYSGALDTTFNTNFVRPSWSSTLGNFECKVIGNRLYVFNEGLTAYNLNGTIDNTFTANLPTGIVPAIRDIVEYNGLIYLVGNFYESGSKWNAFRVLNYDGTLNSTENTKFSNQNPNAFVVALSIKVYNNKFYVTGGNYFITWSGTQIDRFAVIDPSTALLDPTFHTVNAGFGSGADVFACDVNTNGIYVATNCGNYRGTSIHPVVKLNFNGSLDSAFSTGSILNFIGTVANVVDLKLNNNGDVYISGTLQTVNGVTTKGMAKLDGATGALDTSFDVNLGFTESDWNINVNQFYLKNADVIPLEEIDISFSAESPCAAYCNTPYSTTIYGNGPSLVQSTILYVDANGTTPVAMGWYSDGGSIAEVDGSGIIIGYTNINTCSCNTLYAFNVTYDLVECVACGETGTPVIETVYGANPNWSSNSVLYFNQAGSVFAAPGWYAFNASIVLYVDANGYVVFVEDCFVDCTPPVGCISQRILNSSGDFNDWSYRNCDGFIESGTMFPGEVLFTSCMQIGSFIASESYDIQRTFECPE